MSYVTSYDFAETAYARFELRGALLMNLFVVCDQCRSRAVVIRLVLQPSELAEISETLELDDAIEEYMIIGCPKCGLRVIDPPPVESAGND